MRRPPKDSSGPATETLTLRLSIADREILDRLVALRAEELGDEAVEVTAASYVRALLRREARAKGVLPSSGIAPAEPGGPVEARASALKDPVADELRAALAQAIAAGALQSDLAREAGINKSEVSRFKAGQRGLSTEARRRLGEAIRKHVR